MELTVPSDLAKKGGSLTTRSEDKQCHRDLSAVSGVPGSAKLKKFVGGEPLDIKCETRVLVGIM